MLCFSEINYSLVDSFQHIYVCVDASTHTKNYLLVGGVAEHGWVSERRDTFRSQSSVRKEKIKEQPFHKALPWFNHGSTRREKNAGKKIESALIWG